MKNVQPEGESAVYLSNMVLPNMMSNLCELVFSRCFCNSSTALLSNLLTTKEKERIATSANNRNVQLFLAKGLPELNELS